MKRIGVKKHITPHTLRNNFAKRCLLAGMDIPTHIWRRLFWKSKPTALPKRSANGVVFLIYSFQNEWFVFDLTFQIWYNQLTSF